MQSMQHDIKPRRICAFDQDAVLYGLAKTKKLKGILDILASSIYMETGNYEFWDYILSPNLLNSKVKKL